MMSISIARAVCLMTVLTCGVFLAGCPCPNTVQVHNDTINPVTGNRELALISLAVLQLIPPRPAHGDPAPFVGKRQLERALDLALALKNA